jgi:AhpD family alkylhydroperoxidase
MRTTQTYPERYDHLQWRLPALGVEAPGVMTAFGHLHKESTAGGALRTKHKELIALALAIAITSRCDGCVAYHVHDALRAGAERAEIIEALGVAIMMGGGPALVYACEALEALEQFAQREESGVAP